MAANNDISPSINGVRIRSARLEDLSEINNLLARVEFDVGVHILELYFLNSKRHWQVAVNESNEIVGFDSVHELPVKGIRFGFDMFVRDDYRNRGIVGRFGTVTDQSPLLGNATPTAMKQIVQFDNFDMKLLGYLGKVNNRSIDQSINQSADDYDIFLLIDPNDMKNLLKYDRSVLDLDRTQFMREWCSISKSEQTFARTLVAKRKSDNAVVGFGTLRRFSSFYGIMPLYADDQSIAERILNEIVNLFVGECGSNEFLYVFFDAKNRLMMEFVHRINLELSDSELREYSRGAQEIKKYIRSEKVYALLDYWPV